VNPSSGDGSGPGAEDLFDAASGLGVRVVVLNGDLDPAEVAAAEASGASALGMAGGDGSLGSVAAEAMREDIPFVCVPFGTRNHFALDLGLDRTDPLAALDAFVDRRELLVDVARVRDRVMLNNLTLGVYAEAVHSDRYRDAKVAEGVRITREMLRGDRDPDNFVVVDPDGHRHESPFALVVANNCYGSGAKLSSLGRRERLDEGLLQVSMVETDSGWDLASLLWTAAGGGSIDDHQALTQWITDAVTVESGQPTVKVGLDGEAIELDAPFTVRIAPRSLRILVPATGSG
jgi:diacylglycerol kinase family enzyme